MSTEPGGDPPQRVSVSLEALRTEIRLANAELEIRLTNALASKSSVEQLQIEQNRIQSRLELVEATQARREPLAARFDKEFDAIKDDVELLQKSKASDDAVKSYKRYLLGGGAITAIILIAQFLLAVWVATQGAGGGASA